jgi:hypothetical protein
MVLVIIAFCAAFLLIASGGLLLFYREAMLSAFRSDQSAPQEEEL